MRRLPYTILVLVAAVFFGCAVYLFADSVIRRMHAAQRSRSSGADAVLYVPVIASLSLGLASLIAGLGQVRRNDRPFIRKGHR